MSESNNIKEQLQDENANKNSITTTATDDTITETESSEALEKTVAEAINEDFNGMENNTNLKDENSEKAQKSLISLHDYKENNTSTRIQIQINSKNEDVCQKHQENYSIFDKDDGNNEIQGDEEGRQSNTNEIDSNNSIALPPTMTMLLKDDNKVNPNMIDDLIGKGYANIGEEDGKTNGINYLSDGTLRRSNSNQSLLLNLINIKDNRNPNDKDIISQFIDSGGIVDDFDDSLNDDSINNNNDDMNGDNNNDIERVQSITSISYKVSSIDDSYTDISTSSDSDGDDVADYDSLSTTITEKKKIESLTTMYKLNIDLSSCSLSSSLASSFVSENFNVQDSRLSSSSGSNNNDLWKLLQKSVAKHTCRITNEKIKQKQEMRRRSSSFRSLDDTRDSKILLESRLSLQQHLLSEYNDINEMLIDASTDASSNHTSSRSLSSLRRQPRSFCAFCKCIFSSVSSNSSYYVVNDENSNASYRRSSAMSSLGYNIHSSK